MTDLGNEKFKINYCKTNEVDLEYLKLGYDFNNNLSNFNYFNY